MLFLGSIAARHWFPDHRVPNDIDIIEYGVEKTVSTHVRGIKLEIFAEPLFTHILDINKDNTFVDADILLTLKMSHANWNIHWDKTMYDIKFFKERGVVPNRKLYDYFVSEWSKFHGKKPGNLNQTKDDFFNDAVKREFDHDWLHEQVAFFGEPLYKSILKEGAEVLCCEEKYEGLTDVRKKMLLYEEAIVTAIERYRLHKASTNAEIRTAFFACYRKLILTMSNGWFAFALIDNFNHLSKDWNLISAQIKLVTRNLNYDTK